MSGNTVGNTECPTHLEQGMVVPAIWLTDEDPGFISALKDFQEIFPGESTGFRCHWHLGKDVNKHIACIHEDHSKVHTLWESALYKTTEPGFEEHLPFCWLRWSHLNLFTTTLRTPYTLLGCGGQHTPVFHSGL